MALLVAVALGAWITAGTWGPRPPAGEDTMAHLIRAEFAIRNLVNHARVDGWQPSFILGYQEFLFLGPGFTWAVALVRALTFGVLSIPGAFKVVLVGSFVVQPLAVAYLARSFRLDRYAAAVAAVLSLAVNNPFGGVGVNGLFKVGLVTQHFGAIFFFLAVGGMLRVLTTSSPRSVIVTAVSTAALAASHGVSLLVFALLVGVMVVTTVFGDLRLRLRRSEAGSAPDEEAGHDPPLLARLGLVGLSFVIAAALAACVLLPYWAHRNLRGTLTGWGVAPLGTRLAEMWKGEFLFGPNVAPLVVAGLLHGAWHVRRHKRHSLTFVAAAPLYVLAAYGAFHLWPGNVFTPQLTNRSLGYIGVLAVLPLAPLLVRLARLVPVPSWQFPAALAGATAVVLISLGDARDVADQMPEPIPQLAQAARQLAQMVPEGARFATERDFPSEIDRTRLVNPDRWLAWASGRNTLNIFNPESSATPNPGFEVEHIDDRPPVAVADALSRLGVTHLVTTSENAAAQIGSSNRFRQLWQAAPVTIFSVSAPPGQPDPSALISGDGPLGARLTMAKPERLEIDVEAPQPVRTSVAIGWSPKWHAELNGRPIGLQKADDGLLELHLPRGSGRLELTFRRDLWDRLGASVSLATLLAVVTWTLRHRLASSRSQDRGPSSDIGAIVSPGGAHPCQMF